MVNNTCFLFGHSDTPDTILPPLRNAIETYIRNRGVQTFFVGHYGEFDRLARVALLQLKEKYPEIRLYMLIPYHPADRSVQAPEGFAGTHYPPLEGVPRRYAIVRANRHMVQQADGIICYVRHFGNTRNLLELAIKRGVPVHNLAEEAQKQQPLIPNR